MIKQRIVKTARDVVGKALQVAKVTDPGKRARGMLTIATFHRVLPASLSKEYPFPILSVTPEHLDFCVRYFQQHYTPGPMSEIFRRFRAGEEPKKPLLAITFDDGQLDNFEYARDVLARRGQAATFYLPTDAMDRGEPLWHDTLGFTCFEGYRKGGALLAELSQLFRVDPKTAPNEIEWATWVSLDVKHLTPADRDARIRRAVEIFGRDPVPAWSKLMSWEQAKVIAKDGHELGSHSLSHPLLPQLDAAAQEREIRESKVVIEARTGAKVTSFCYPNGDHSDEIVAITRRAGYENAVTAEHGNNPRGVDPMRLKRFDMIWRKTLHANGASSASQIAWWLSGLYPED